MAVYESMKSFRVFSYASCLKMTNISGIISPIIRIFNQLTWPIAHNISLPLDALKVSDPMYRSCAYIVVR
jgi:hypothetical protein